MIAGGLWVVYDPSTTVVLVCVWLSVSIVDVMFNSVFDDEKVPAMLRKLIQLNEFDKRLNTILN